MAGAVGAALLTPADRMPPHRLLALSAAAAAACTCACTPAGGAGPRTAGAVSLPAATTGSPADDRATVEILPRGVRPQPAP